MNLRIETVTKKFKDIDKLNDIFIEAFPKEERDNKNFYESFDDTNELSKVYCVYDDSNANLVGLVVGLDIEDVFYIVFFATNKNVRSCGYGSKIINLIKNMYKEKTIIACIESTKEENASNTDQRIKRKEFYIRNGFMISELTLNWKNIDFEVIISKQYDNLKGIMEKVLKMLD